MNPAGRQQDSLAAAARLLEGRELVEEEALCLNIRGRMEHCERCTTVCHVEALAPTPDALEVLPDRCTGCGACVPACPAGALRLSGFSPARLLDALAGETEVHLHCTESLDAGGGVVIPCFKVLDARLLAAARAEGVEGLILHGLDRCADCRHGGALSAVGRMRFELENALGASAPRLSPADGPAAATEGAEGRRREDQPRLDRRAFLRLAGAQAAGGMARWLVPLEEDDGVPELPFFQGDPEDLRRPHPYQALLAGRVARVPWAEGATLPWQGRSIAAHCTGCMACGRRCPTGALLAEERDRTRLLSFEQALCTDCGLCGRLCPVDAVRTDPVSDVEAVGAARGTLLMRRLATCDHCGIAFLPEPDAGDATTCSTCSNEQDLDDEWLGMLEG